MNQTQKLIEKLQQQPQATRIKIVWAGVAIAALILFVIWVFSLRSTIKNLNGVDLIKLPTSEPTNNQGQIQTATPYATVERAESTALNFKLYFNFNNSTNDILNLPALTDITLKINNQTIKPTKITDRQNQPFVQKILSHTQNFGILIFPKTNADAADLNFNQMYFEQTPNALFNQKIKLNLKDLEKSALLRN